MFLISLVLHISHAKFFSQYENRIKVLKEKLTSLESRGPGILLLPSQKSLDELLTDAEEMMTNLKDEKTVQKGKKILKHNEVEFQQRKMEMASIKKEIQQLIDKIHTVQKARKHPNKTFVVEGPGEVRRLHEGEQVPRGAFYTVIRQGPNGEFQGSSHGVG
jgi:chromosome segregation ATPase